MTYLLCCLLALPIVDSGLLRRVQACAQRMAEDDSRMGYEKATVIGKHRLGPTWSVICVQFKERSGTGLFLISTDGWIFYGYGQEIKVWMQSEIDWETAVKYYRR